MIQGTAQVEAELIRKIRFSRPPRFQRRYRELMRNYRAETLTPAEYEELLQCSEQAEFYDGNRLQALIELARLRQTSVEGLVRDLGLVKSPPI